MPEYLESFLVLSQKEQYILYITNNLAHHKQAYLHTCQCFRAAWCMLLQDLDSPRRAELFDFAGHKDGGSRLVGNVGNCSWIDRTSDVWKLE